jgi:hypothetical protein
MLVRWKLTAYCTIKAYIHVRRAYSLNMNTLVNSANELNTELVFGATGLHHAKGDCSTLPGQPRIDLDTLDYNGYLEKEHLTPDLDQLAPRLWLASAMYQYNH